MGLSVKHLKDALERRGDPPLARSRYDPYPLRPPSPLPWFYRVDPLILLMQIAAIVIVALWAFA